MFEVLNIYLFINFTSKTFWIFLGRKNFYFSFLALFLIVDSFFLSSLYTHWVWLFFVHQIRAFKIWLTTKIIKHFDYVRNVDFPSFRPKAFFSQARLFTEMTFFLKLFRLLVRFNFSVLKKAFENILRRTSFSARELNKQIDWFKKHFNLIFKRFCNEKKKN